MVEAGTFHPLFLTGVARSGSKLLCRMLDAHPDIVAAADPFLVLFRWLRNAIVQERGGGAAVSGFDSDGPLQDYYFSDEHLSVMDAIQSSDLDVAFDASHWARFQEDCERRTKEECPDLANHLARLRAESYAEIMKRALDLIVDVRHGDRARWVGFKELWVVEFFKPLARSMPEARFVLLHRDPRAVVASMLAMGAKHPKQLAHAYSFARHWRKYVAFSLRFQRERLFDRRLHVLTYEALVGRPEKTARALCEFLGVNFQPTILNTNTYIDQRTGKKWDGDSSFEAASDGFDRARAERWRTALDPKVIKMIELVCGPEMRAIGYEPVTAATPDPEILEYLIEENAGKFSWRSDSGDPQKDYAFEAARMAMLHQSPDEAAVRRAFLFPEVFEILKRHCGQPA